MLPNQQDSISSIIEAIKNMYAFNLLHNSILKFFDVFFYHFNNPSALTRLELDPKRSEQLDLKLKITKYFNHCFRYITQNLIRWTEIIDKTNQQISQTLLSAKSIPIKRNYFWNKILSFEQRVVTKYSANLYKGENIKMPSKRQS